MYLLYMVGVDLARIPVRDLVFVVWAVPVGVDLARISIRDLVFVAWAGGDFCTSPGDPPPLLLAR